VFKRLFTGGNGKVRCFLPLGNHVTLAYACALANPFIAGVHAGGQIIVGDNAFWKIRPCSGNQSLTHADQSSSF